MTVVAPRDQQRRYHWMLLPVVQAQGLAPIPELCEELRGYAMVLDGWAPSPMDGRERPLSMHEVAAAFYSRAMGIRAEILELEMTPVDPTDPKSPRKVPKGSPYYEFRTGVLQTRIEQFEKAGMRLGSRRLAELEYEQAERGDSCR